MLPEDKETCTNLRQLLKITPAARKQEKELWDLCYTAVMIKNTTGLVFLRPTESTLYYQNWNFLFLFDPPAGSGTAESCHCHYHPPNALWWNYCSKRHLSSTFLHPPSFFSQRSPRGETAWDRGNYLAEEKKKSTPVVKFPMKGSFWQF